MHVGYHFAISVIAASSNIEYQVVQYVCQSCNHRYGKVISDSLLEVLLSITNHNVYSSHRIFYRY